MSSGSVLAASLPAHDVHERFAAMSLATSESARAAAAPAEGSYATHPRVLAFFREQAELGRQPGPTPPMHLPEDVYRKADLGCMATFDSPDWRKRQISIISTEVAFDIFMRELREPILRASSAAIAVLRNKQNPQEVRRRIVETHLICTLPPSYVPEAFRTPFEKDAVTGVLFVAAPYTTLNELAVTLNRYYGKRDQDLPGQIFHSDLMIRMQNIFNYFFKPEYEIFKTFSAKGKAPLVTHFGNTDRFNPITIMELVSQETARRMRDSDFPKEHTNSLVEEFDQSHPEDREMNMQLISEGRSVRDLPCIGW